MVGNELVWVEVDIKGEDGVHYFGRFSVKKYLTHRDRAEAVRSAELLCRGIQQDINFRAFLSTVAFLNIHVKETDAKWWTKDEEGDICGMNLTDESPVWELASKIKEAQKPPEAPKV